MCSQALNSTAHTYVFMANCQDKLFSLVLKKCESTWRMLALLYVYLQREINHFLVFKPDHVTKYSTLIGRARHFRQNESKYTTHDVVPHWSEEQPSTVPYCTSVYCTLLH